MMAGAWEQFLEVIYQPPYHQDHMIYIYEKMHLHIALLLVEKDLHHGFPFKTNSAILNIVVI